MLTSAPDRDKSSFKPSLIVSTNRKNSLDSMVYPGEEPRQSIIIKQHVYWRRYRDLHKSCLREKLQGIQVTVFR